MTDVIFEMAKINIRGNIIDHSWFEHLVKETGKPHLLAANILAEIVYWYKPTEYKDELTSQVTYKKKFKGDKLQKSYAQLADSFGVTKGQVKDACKFLEKKNLIKMELRTIFANGINLNNVMFIEPVPSEIQKISTLYQKNDTPVSKKSHRVCPKNDIGGSKKPHTYTEITTKITTEIKKNNNAHSDEFAQFWNIYPKRRDKQKADTAFKKARKKHSLEVIMSGVNGYVAYLQRNNTEIQFIKHASTFLNAESFLDDFGPDTGGGNNAGHSGKPTQDEEYDLPF